MAVFLNCNPSPSCIKLLEPDVSTFLLSFLWYINMGVGGIHERNIECETPQATLLTLSRIYTRSGK